MQMRTLRRMQGTSGNAVKDAAWTGMQMTLRRKIRLPNFAFVLKALGSKMGFISSGLELTKSPPTERTSSITLPQ